MINEFCSLNIMNAVTRYEILCAKSIRIEIKYWNKQTKKSTTALRYLSFSAYIIQNILRMFYERFKLLQV